MRTPTAEGLLIFFRRHFCAVEISALQAPSQLFEGAQSAVLLWKGIFAEQFGQGRRIFDQSGEGITSRLKITRKQGIFHDMKIGICPPVRSCPRQSSAALIS